MTRLRAITEQNRKWWTLGAMSFSLFMIMLDNTVVNVALPSIQKDLGASLSALEWTINAYTLAIAVLLVSAGRLGDILGRRRAIFFLNLPVAALAIVVALGAVRESRDRTVPRAVDFAGVGTLTLGVGALVLALIEGNAWGWGSGRIVGLLALSAAGLLAFNVV